MSQRQIDIDREITAFRSTSTDDLRDRFNQLYQRPPPAYLSRELLVRAVAYRIQETASGGPDRALQKRLKTMAGTLRQTGKIDLAPAPPVKPGTRLIREWKGRTHEVIVTEAGFIYRDERYQSLSQIARLITGARWSGPRFFGLTLGKRSSGRRHAA